MREEPVKLNPLVFLITCVCSLCVYQNILEGKDTFVLMATGSGKSICYQIPPLVAGKPMIVISPLISLMEDQVLALEEAGISACQLSSSQVEARVWNDAKKGKFALIYMKASYGCPA